MRFDLDALLIWSRVKRCDGEFSWLDLVLYTHIIDYVMNSIKLQSCFIILICICTQETSYRWHEGTKYLTKTSRHHSRVKRCDGEFSWLDLVLYTHIIDYVMNSMKLQSCFIILICICTQEINRRLRILEAGQRKNVRRSWNKLETTN